MYATDTEPSVPRLHAATLLALWLVWLLAGQVAGSPWHELWAGMSITGALLFAPRRFLRLLRRLRWLLIAVLLTFAFATPGRLLIPDFPAGPSVEGLLAALSATGKLIGMAAAVAVLLERLTPARLTGAIHRLVHPLSADHPSAGSFALRLQLVMHEIERQVPGRNWRSWLEDGDSGAPLSVEPCAPLAVLDCVVLAAAAGVLALWHGA
jgi:energy-coupling factor transporter transmembrane protein EcfT